MDRRLKKRVHRTLIAVVLAAVVFIVYAKREYILQLPIGCAFKAKAVCAGVFIQGRDPGVVAVEDVGFNPLFKFFKAKINRGEKSVTCSVLGLGLFRKKAIIVEGLGPVLLSGVPEEDIRAWKAPRSEPRPADPAAVPWPTGDLMPAASPSAAVDTELIDKAVGGLFVESNPKVKLYTRAVVVLVDGRIVAERYGEGITKDTPLLSWSMAKSFTNALVGILSKQGKLSIKEPAPVPEWAAPGDPRHAITLDQLMRMSSGLEWFEDYTAHPVSDVNRMLFLEPDMGAYAASKPLAVRPDSRWSYSSGTTNIVCRILSDAVGGREAFWAFPRRELFDKIGMRSAVWGVDASGVFIGSSYLYATARDYARFGLLCLHDGAWEGERILPEGWMAYSTTPAPAAPLGQYGAFFWLNRGNPDNPAMRPFPGLPTDLYLADGYQGQAIIVIPSRKVVVVRLGMTYDDNWGMPKFLAKVLAAIKP
jgi:CubicO group peptidase (beta-lactamase class C family)